MVSIPNPLLGQGGHVLPALVLDLLSQLIALLEVAAWRSTQGSPTLDPKHPGLGLRVNPKP